MARPSGQIGTSEESGEDSYTKEANDTCYRLQILRNMHLKNIMIGYTNINSVRKKFKEL